MKNIIRKIWLREESDQNEMDQCGDEPKDKLFMNKSNIELKLDLEIELDLVDYSPNPYEGKDIWLNPKLSNTMHGES